MTENQQQIKMPDMSRVIVSSSPHIYQGNRIQWVMAMVLLALLPAVIASIFFFGFDALRVILLCTCCCVGFEAAWHRLCKHPIPVFDLSAVVTGVLLGMNMPSTIPWWICAIASFFAIIIGKAVFGGLGHNPFNPALIGRVAVFLGFSGLMSIWAPTSLMPSTTTSVTSLPGAETANYVLTQATPLGQLATLPENEVWSKALQLGNHGDVLTYWDLFIGNVGGSLGETSALAILLGGIFLLALRLIRWQIPVIYIGTVFVITQMLHWIDPIQFAPGLFHILTGGLFLGAFFMATDMVTTPARPRGQFIFALGCGIITVVIRLFCAYPEGVSFAILFMNAFVPLINRFTGNPKVFGQN